ncbi:unannotated protein [freshwater metagenome]|uniref:Unannotated protein n=1 Tax=freshwater metagenome TaxID=449393 RepID=A0A6J6C5I3_9ZZZZ
MIPCLASALTSGAAIPKSPKVVVISVSGVASTKFASAKFVEM